MPEFNSHLDFFELLSLIRCGRNSAYETGLSRCIFIHFILIYLCRVEYAAKEADFYTTLPKQKLNNLITVI